MKLLRRKRGDIAKSVLRLSTSIYKFRAKYSGLRADAVARQDESSDLQMAGRKRPGRKDGAGPAPKRVNSGSHLLRKERRKERRKDLR